VRTGTEKRPLLTYIRLPRIPRAVVARRLALSTLCAGTIAVAALAPTHGNAAASGGAAAAPAPASQVTDRAAVRGNAVSRGVERSAPAASADPVRDLTPMTPATPGDPAGSGATSSPGATTSPGSAAKQAGKAAEAPARPKRPAQPRLPVIDGLDRYQTENAQTIVNVGRAMGVSERGQIIAVATALQESRLYNLYVAVDHDSLGLFQQRPSTGWGTPQEITTPSYAARAFYTRLLDTTADWGCLTCAAQRVQGSAFPYAYAAQEWFATDIVGAFYRD
jgi:hypothetical protein